AARPAQRAAGGVRGGALPRPGGGAALAAARSRHALHAPGRAPAARRRRRPLPALLLGRAARAAGGPGRQLPLRGHQHLPAGAGPRPLAPRGRRGGAQEGPRVQDG
ncbi:Protein of unknown function, partial [Gryllus bimaculatus]